MCGKYLRSPDPFDEKARSADQGILTSQSCSSSAVICWHIPAANFGFNIKCRGRLWTSAIMTVSYLENTSFLPRRLCDLGGVVAPLLRL